MSTNIHAHVEVKIYGQWHHYTYLELRKIPQDYRLYGRMAGVRDPDVVPLVMPRGLPADATFTTNYVYANSKSDNFAMSWLDAREVVSVAGWYAREVVSVAGWYAALLDRESFNRRNAPDCEDLFGYLFGNSWESLWDGGAAFPAGLEDARLVFWFR